MARTAWGWIPHALSFLRVLLVLSIYYAAYHRDAPLFAVLVMGAVLTDILDGPLARHLGTESRLGANVDSAADAIFYLSLPVWTWMFKADVVHQLRYLIAGFTVLYASVIVLSHIRFRAIGVHNRLSRASGTVGVAGAFYVILWGLEWWVYVVVVAMLAADLAQRFGALLRANFGKPQDIIR
ncbi:MAG TPA: CDP-alcohol phosphatidyltransferase family protein [Candidatus Thermoplasmatota archaeon]|nr:CDP-alcohol phosphatidyltransferase family protein [Candidatus Thermoplasmatota archaeon]